MDSPWFLRITALFLAILLVYTVQVEKKDVNKNSSNQEVGVLQDIPVEVYYDNENLIVTGVPQTVNVTIEGPTNIVQTTKLFKDFTLFVDLRSLTMGEHEVRIEHENMSDKLQVQIDPSTIDVSIEEKITEIFRVEPEFNERLLADGYNLTDMEVNPKTIEVTGAKSVVESISFVKATVSTDPDVKSSFEKEATVRVLDRDLNKLDIEMTPENVRVKVEIEENSKEVPIILNEKGTLPNGVTVHSITPEKDKITLSGPKRILNEINQLVVDLDLSKITKSETIEVKLQKPDDVVKLSTATLLVKVDVKVEGADEQLEQEEESEEKKAETEGETGVTQFVDVAIVVSGLNPKFKGTIIRPVNGSVDLVVKAAQDKVGSLTQADFTVTIDASNIEEIGEYVYPIHVKGPPQVEWVLSVGDATLKVELA